jgi:hypothetical protein
VQSVCEGARAVKCWSTKLEQGTPLCSHKLVISYSELHLIHVVHSFEEVTRYAFAWHKMLAALTWVGRSGGSRAEIRTFVESRCSSKWPLAGIWSRPVL